MRSVAGHCVLFVWVVSATVPVGAQFVPSNLTPTQLATGFSFTEGPAPDGKGGLWFTDIPNNNIYRFDIETGVTELAVENSGGANGLMFDDQGRLLAAEGVAQRLTRRSGVPLGDQLEVLADSWAGQPLNSPNDMVIDSSGGIYFTDPGYFHEVQTEAVYYLNADGQMSQIIADLNRPNGIALSPDETRLYVADPGENPNAVRNGRSRIMVYDLVEAGVPVNGQLFAQWFADGLAVDAHGNLFASTFRGFAAWTADGEQLFWERSPGATTNVAFEDSSGTYPNRLYVTSGGSLYRTEILALDAPRGAVGFRRFPEPVSQIRDLDFDGLGDRTSPVFTAFNGLVGEIDRSASNRLNRIVGKFELPDVSLTLHRATLRFFLDDIEGVPGGPVSVYHSVDDNDRAIDASDYEDASYQDTLFDLVQPTAEVDNYYELDVTEWVQADYANDEINPLSAFRLQVSEQQFDEDDESNFYRFSMPGRNRDYPELVLVFVPEPSAWTMAWFGLASLIAVRPSARLAAPPTNNPNAC